MENKIFMRRKKFLERYFKKKIFFVVGNEEDDGFNSLTSYVSNILNWGRYNKHFVKKLKELTYYHLSKCLNEEQNIDKINIEMFTPDLDDHVLNNPSFNEESLIYENIRIFSLDTLVNPHFLGLFDYTFHMFVDDNEFILCPTRNFRFLISCKTQKNKNVINLPKCFKSEFCIICLTNDTNVIFCNCGHVPICKECSTVKTFTECPICKTKNEIVRIME